MGKRKKSRVSRDEDEEDEVVQEEEGNHSSSNEKSLYEILGVEKTASQQEIKKAYYKLALRLHPDKNPGDEEAKEKFQQLQKVISILGDEEKRAVYDQTGCVDDTDLAGDVVENLKSFFRTMYKKVTAFVSLYVILTLGFCSILFTLVESLDRINNQPPVLELPVPIEAYRSVNRFLFQVTDADIEEFEANYRGSDSEKKDLIDLYRKFKGNMNKLFCSMLCSDPKLDSHRFKDMLDEAIAAGELKESKAYKKWAQKVSEMRPPTSPLRRKGKSNKQPESDLFAIISQRRNERKDRFDSMFSSLVSKYGGNAESEPTEEEFEAAKRKVESKKASNKSKRKRQ
ncbi:hypothetical protein CXB51_001349 [Gossypium anomalum]|uniref:J domain-containing protein n=1 Tax=Gossypium anomalum TaxID=47600 RepID=A0A8J5ZP93_9ROSI|nr:hypothetical protein CXB51_001349 [Gossypium anomalum]